MNKLSTLLSALVIGVTLASSIAIAREADRTVVGQLTPHETKPVSFKVVPGDFSIQVFSNVERAKITCKFVDGAGNVGLVQTLADRCVGNVKLKQPGSMSVVITNEDGRLIDFNVLIQDKNQ